MKTSLLEANILPGILKSPLLFWRTKAAFYVDTTRPSVHYILVKLNESSLRVWSMPILFLICIKVSQVTDNLLLHAYRHRIFITSNKKVVTALSTKEDGQTIVTETCRIFNDVFYKLF